MRYVGEHFRDQRVQLDGNEFESCRFTNVVFDYAGGPVSLCGCSFDNFRWRLGGDLGRGLTMLGALYATRQSAGIGLVANTMFPKPAKPAEAAPLHPSLAALLEAEAREDAEVKATPSAESIDYGRLRAAIRRKPGLGSAPGHC